MYLSNMKICLTTLNSKYIHKNLALRWLYVSRNKDDLVEIKEYTIKDDLERIYLELTTNDYDIIGFSTYIWNIDQIVLLCQKIRANFPDIKLILGGPEVSYENDHLLPYVDYIIQGEGEIAFWQIVSNLKNNIDENILGVKTKTFSTNFQNKVPLDYLESLESPYFLEFDLESMANKYLYFETSRGCPYSCAYCLSSLETGVRFFSQEYVIAHLKKISETKIKQIKFLDRTLNLDNEWFKTLIKTINKYHNDQVYQFEIVIEKLDEDLIKFLDDNCPKERYRFEVGIQSTNEITNLEVNRNSNFRNIKKIIDRLNVNHNIELHLDLIAGLPFENYDRFKKSFNDVFELAGDEVQLGFLKCLKGTKLRRFASKYGIEYEKKAPYEVIKTNDLSSEELDKLRIIAKFVDNLWNKKRMVNTINYLVENSYFESYFDFFESLISKYDRSIFLNYTNLFLYVKKILIEKGFDQILIDSLLNTEYYRLFKQRPKRISSKYEFEVNYYQMINEKYGIPLNSLYNYGRIDLGYDSGELGILVLLYNKEHEYPKTYFINRCNLIREIER